MPKEGLRRRILTTVDGLRCILKRPSISTPSARRQLTEGYASPRASGGPQVAFSSSTEGAKSYSPSGGQSVVSPVPISGPSTEDQFGGDTAIWALLISIDTYKYKGVTDLIGSKNDADDVYAFLTLDRKVPPGRIQRLSDRKATRKAIIHHIQSLATDPKIKRGDPILIYYAGHGAQAPPPKGWPAGGENAKIQMICPYDFVPDSSSSEAEQGIPDITLSCLLSKLAKEKGDNITVIFDCCHAGSGTRDMKTRARSIKIPTKYAILPELDKKIRGDAGNAALFPGNEGEGSLAAFGGDPKYASLRSHVLLAASSSGSLTYENDGRGDFTRELFTILRRPSARFFTYKDVIRSIHLPQQRPQCEGLNASRIIFRSTCPPPRRMLYGLSEDEGRIILEAGIAQGVELKSRFHAFTSNADGNPIGTLVVKKLTVSRALMGWTSDSQPISPIIPTDASALMIHTGDRAPVKIVVHDPEMRTLLQAVARAMEERYPAMDRVEIREPESDGVPHHELKMDGTRLLFDGRSISGVDDIQIPYSIASAPNSDGMMAQLLHVAAFFSRLHRSSAEKTLQDSVKIPEFFAFNDPQGAANTFATLRVNSAGKVENLICEDGLLNIKADLEGRTKRYGFAIKSAIDKPLYVWVYIFNPSELTIQCIYSPCSRSMDDPDPSLQPGGELTIGYGASGVGPQAFDLPRGADAGLAFIKIVFSTNPLDLPDIEMGPLHFATIPRDDRGPSGTPHIVKFEPEPRLTPSTSTSGSTRLSKPSPPPSIFAPSPTERLPSASGFHFQPDHTLLGSMLFSIAIRKPSM